MILISFIDIYDMIHEFIFYFYIFNLWTVTMTMSCLSSLV